MIPELYTGAPTSKVPLALIRIPVNSVVVNVETYVEPLLIPVVPALPDDGASTKYMSK